MSFSLSQPRAWGGPVGTGVIKTVPEDFFVDECLTLPEGEGEHWYCRIEKRETNTDYLATQLALGLGIPDADIGYCGLKDRHAVTRQWFSLRLPGCRALGPNDVAVPAGCRVLAIQRGPAKLRRGQHDANHFEIRVRVPMTLRAAADERLDRVRLGGFPNYFGSQRFGLEGENLTRAARMPSGRQRRRDPKEGLYLSAARGYLFNQVLAARVQDGTWNLLREGDVGVPYGDLTLPSGPLFGERGGGATAPLQAWEDAFLVAHPSFQRVFADRRLRPERRALAVRPQAMEWTWDEQGVRVGFSLPPGSYATTLLAEVFDLIEPERQ